MIATRLTTPGGDLALLPPNVQQAVAAVWDRRPIHRYAKSPIGRRVERELIGYWFEPMPDRARAYMAALAPVVAELRRREESASARLRSSVVPDLDLPRVLHHFVLTNVLGAGGDGLVLRAEDTATGAAVAIKSPAYGEYILAQLLDSWHPNIVRIVDSGMILDPPNFWCAMEFGDETLDDVLRRQRGTPLPRNEALAIFAACCEAVAFLHDHHVYRWSGHQRNVVRVGDVWQITDHGRVRILLDRDHPTLVEWRDALIAGFALAPGEAGLGADWLLSHQLLDAPFYAGMGLRDPDLERRLRQDDISRLGGLLVDVLGGRRWDYFYRAIVREPYCSARYRLTGDPVVDERLTAMLNRCWRGEAGGAPLVANGGHGEQSTYDDANQLLADVEVVLG